MHARDLLLGDTFRRTPAATSVRRNVPCTRAVMLVTLRFSNPSGFLLTAPPGYAVRFHLARRQVYNPGGSVLSRIAAPRW